MSKEKDRDTTTTTTTSSTFVLPYCFRTTCGGCCGTFVSNDVEGKNTKETTTTTTPISSSSFSTRIFHRRKHDLLTCVPCSAEKKTRRRNIVSKGMTRFRTGIRNREQEPWEKLSDRIACVLGGNPGPYTLAGTCCYLIGSGRSRFLVDCGERYVGTTTLIRNLRNCMNALGCEEIAGIIVTHLHHDHFGGIYAVQEAFGPDIPVWKSHVPDHWFRTYREIERRGLLKRFLREEDGELIFHPKRDLFATKNDD